MSRGASRTRPVKGTDTGCTGGEGRVVVGGRALLLLELFSASFLRNTVIFGAQRLQGYFSHVFQGVVV